MSRRAGACRLHGGDLYHHHLHCGVVLSMACHDEAAAHPHARQYRHGWRWRVANTFGNIFQLCIALYEGIICALA